MRKIMIERTLLARSVAVLLGAAMTLGACESEPDDLGDAAHEAGDAVEDAGESLEDAVDETGDAIDDAVDDVTDGG